MKILMICNTDGALLFRKPIIQRLITLGHSVLSISSESSYFGWLKKEGVFPIAVDFARHSVSPWQNLGLFVKLYRLIRLHRPDVVHNFTHKPAIYGTAAARLAGVEKIFVTITGLGTLFMREDRLSRIFRALLILQYKLVLRFATRVFFQNPDDMEYFVSRKILDANRATLTFGSGIDLTEFPVPAAAERLDGKAALSKELDIDLNHRKLVLFPARGVPEKGFHEFYTAARMINAIAPEEYLFLHLGLVDVESSTNISRAGIEEYAADNGVRYLGFKDNIRDYMAVAEIVVLPSYREGTPRSLLEALALGKVIVTTDAPGCRETVIDGWNGFLCKVGDAQSLVAKLLAVDSEIIDKAKFRSRQYCEMKYDSNWLVNLTVNCYS